MVEIAQKIGGLFFNIVFPIECFSCGSYGSWWCNACQDRVVFMVDRTCLGCGRVSVRGETCFACLKSRYPLDGFISAVTYREEQIKKSIGYLKYNGVRDLSGPLGALLASAFFNSSLTDRWWHAVAVPLHVRRERMRGFNQSAHIAQSFSNNTGIEVLPVIKRVRATHPQMELSAKERRKNMEKSPFEITNPALVAGKNILLIDDVATTGSTLVACAKELKKAGASRVWAITVAHG